MLALFPEGFEEVEHDGAIELAAYTDAAGEERVWHVFGAAQSTDVEDGLGGPLARVPPAGRGRPLWVGPPWERAAAGALAVVIDPGRAFGTGAHPTTRLCLELLQDVEPGCLLDVGCGSGVLVDRRRAARLRAGLRCRRRAGRGRGDASERRRERRRRRRELVAREDALPPASIAVANISLAGRAPRPPNASTATHADHVGYLRLRPPELARAGVNSERAGFSTAGPPTCFTRA